MARLSGTVDPFGGTRTAPSIASGYTYRTGNKDGVFFVDNLNDASGTGPSDFMEVFGGYGTKTGIGTINWFWGSVQHKSSGEAGLFIGDLTATSDGAGGNLWGQHMVLQDDKGAKMVGSRIELGSSVARPGGAKDAIGLQVRNTNDSIALDQAIRITGNWTRPFIAYSDNAGSTISTDLDRAGNWRTGGSYSLFSPDGSGTTGMFRAREAATTSTPVFGTRTIGDVQDRLQIIADGRLNWADPSAGGVYANLYASSGLVKTDFSVQVEGNVSLNGGSSGFVARKALVGTQFAFASRLATDTVDRLAIRADGRLVFSDGTASSDVNLERGGTSILTTNGKHAATTGFAVGVGADFASGVRVVAIQNATTAPSATPSGGGVLYANAGALVYKGSSGTVTTIAPA